MFKAVVKLITLLLTFTALSGVVYADNKVVRVGWYESPFNYMDEFGRRSGYAYDYQQKIATYTGWTYEYVNGTWPELYTMLVNGQIDLLSDVSYVPDRVGLMLFPSMPMGAESYWLFIASSNHSITSDPASLNGKKVGVNAHSYQAVLFRQWAADNGVNVQSIDMTEPEKTALAKVVTGELDGYVTLGNYEDENDHACVPILNVGQSNFFFAVNKNRPDLLNELNFAMGKVNDENRFYDDYLYNKYLKSSGTNALISGDELHWLLQHDTIRVGYLNNFAPFCDRSISGEADGVLKKYLELVSNCTKNVVIKFDTKAYSTLQDAFQALVDNEIDCVFPVHLSIHDAEAMGIMTTNSFIQTEMQLMTSKSSSKVISADQPIVVAVNGTNANHKTFLMDNYPNWKTLDCNSLDEALDAVESLRADCALVNNYQATQISSDKYGLYALATGRTMNFAFAVRRSDPKLYYILNKTANLVPSAPLQSALTEYSSSSVDFSFGEFLRMHMYLVIAVGSVLAIAALAFIKRQSARNEKMLKAQLAIQAQQLDNEQRAQEIDAMILAIAADYRSIYSVDLEHDEGCCYRARNITGNQESDLKGIKMGERFSFRENFIKYANDFVVPADRDKFLQFIEPENIRENLSKDTITGHRYRTIKNGVEQYEMIRIMNTYSESLEQINFISVGFADIDSETRELMQQNRSMSEALQHAQIA